MAKLNTLEYGTIINFAYRDWYLLNPSTGLILSKDAVTAMAFDPDNTNIFNPSDINNIGYYLNTTFYNTLTTEQKSIIVAKSWHIGDEKNESGRQVTANIGLLTYSEWQRYGTNYGGKIPYLPSQFGAWLITPQSTNGSYGVWSVHPTNGSVNGHQALTSLVVRPAIMLKPSTNVINGAVVDNVAPSVVQIPTQFVKKNATITINLANYFTDADEDALTFSSLSSNTGIATVSVAGNMLTITGVSIGTSLITITASDSKLTASQSFTTTVANSIPTVAVTAPSANVTLYENDLFNMAGQAADVDANQSVTVYAQINSEQRIVLGIGLSNAPVTFNKSLKFKGGQLFDGETPITGNLIDGIPHTLKIWAQDGDGGQSTITERTFYVVPNRPPTLTIDTVQPSGIINTDKFVISGTVGDPDGNPITAAYKINGGNSIVLEITEGRWAFDISLAQLVVGQNTIVVELVDSYNYKVSKTIKLNKNEVKTPILNSVARYKIELPKGSAKGVLLFIERDTDLDLQVELSMTLAGEQEQYVTLTPDNTAPVPNKSNVVEDTFYHEANEQKTNVILKLSTSREDVNIHRKIHLVSGVVE